ncbi:hypothetical protein CEY16_10025 [Halalkalibacillus sediminis]|uniref:Uncharacterized protein n=1 Tax=Halalkalibacillus sediminis TaxID=2018042 RepID=A0A2I0QRV1_9BACI|nr:hypothetical protein [Halalkalibacillus sediminis]PKR77075.1 hypothetical protein CEY16_10025 [Halalkalibacillus sediminis]
MVFRHPYVKVRREIDHWNFEQKYIEEEFWVELTEEKITTDELVFSIEKVFDLSYKMLSEGYGFFYLHTSKGVFTLQVKENPSEFIEKFREVERK